LFIILKTYLPIARTTPVQGNDTVTTKNVRTKDDERYIMKKQIIEKKLHEDTMLFNVDDNQLHILNPTAHLIYQLVQQGYDANSIENEIKNRFKNHQHISIHSDIQTCMQELKEKSLI